MREQGFEPYFDPEKRKLVDPSNYPARQADTANVIRRGRRRRTILRCC